MDGKDTLKDARVSVMLQMAWASCPLCASFDFDLESLELTAASDFDSSLLAMLSTLFCSLLLFTELNFTSFCWPNCTANSVAEGEFVFGAGETF